MPELPDITVYMEQLARFTQGHVLQGLRIASPFLLRSYDPPVSELIGRTITGTGRIGKRLVLHFEGDLHAVIHLMVAGRLRWKPKGAGVPGKIGLAAFDFDHGTIVFTEASQKKRASLTLVRGEAALVEIHRGGIDIMTSTDAAVGAALREENHTIKRALTDPTIIDGIGNAYSDEILHAAKMSPFRQTKDLTDADVKAVCTATRETITLWTDRLRSEVGDGFPDDVTAFHDAMAAHGKFGKPCPRCGSPIQRIRYADNEANYCATCQTGGKLLADRGLSRLLKSDWPKSLAELEERKAKLRQEKPPPGADSPVLPSRQPDTDSRSRTGKKPRKR
ncbi:MAG TPA: DNA-formamidopyrimidine glycosylase family protein [Kofleriaceae bacterium]|nr:DNA-formamidopyrimidine glycosylase family protein [Kofleriaceae bacterium]